MHDASPAYVFIHGSCHGAWCWRDVIAQMQAKGHTARALDLPPYRPAPHAQVTLQDYRQTILDDIDAHGGAPVILVGHSAGGYAITAAAAYASEKVAELVYVCAYVPQAGQSLADMRKTADHQPILDLIRKTPDGEAFEFRTDTGRDALYHDCADALAQKAMAQLRPQPIAPQSTPVPDLAPAQNITRRYIICTQDRVIPPVEQEKMTADWPQGSIERMNCGHSPFLADPTGLVSLLISSP
ncbi:alpha/beta fold hydrolase [Pacificibacter marinus]|uniref:Pyrethroid hydrolase n=1 Tax=Pacificibacter marinus TaxID=658057 RepID=A0A1Y5SGE6_9RHOB|nr:alpha/beta fold hydrolase [Pacificibacter marinus]SEK53778.1 Pimeloyl-ACP methyl ester carboxylesterase [Pacificibacter marinus]SLN39024.1 Pyrethroid hydrolase [Pacificibacter marinus]